ncbi:MAG TPA: phosphopantetheine-binding protein [Pilimelia sp.]|nr:phosphopantetheine-binding protein [Pilimelia sp.]
MELDEVRAAVAAALEVTPGEIGYDDDLLDHGLDSVRIMSLVESWRAGGRDVAFADLAEEPTVRAWAALLA